MTTGSEILVLGASGRIGQLLRLRWPEELRAQSRWHSRRPQPGAGWFCFDPLENPAALAQAAQGCAQILCLAGPVPGRGGGRGPGRFPAQDGALAAGAMRPHIDLALAAVRAARPGARVLLASSAAVYGPAVCAREDQRLTPANPYGVAKAEMEAAAQQLGHELNISVTSLRIGNIAGFDAALGGWRAGFTLDQFADGSTPRRSYIAPSLLAEVLARLLRQPVLPDVLNIAQPGPMAMGDLLRAAGRAFATRPAPDTALPEVALDLSRLEGLLGAEWPLTLPRAEAGAMAQDWAELAPLIN